MWISTVTYNVLSLRNDAEFMFNPLFNTKKLELQELDGAGTSLPGWEIPAWIGTGDIPEEIESVVIKRIWNVEQNANDFGNLIIDSFGSHVTVQTEEQV